MKLLKIVKRRSFFSEVVYIVLNIGLTAALVLVTQVTGSPVPAFGLVLLSMWRVLAVRPRFWVANIQANLVSLIVSIGFVIFLYNTSIANINGLQSIVIQSILAVLYVVWLLFLKPQSKRIYVVMQAAVATFVGITSIYTMTYGWLVLVVVLLVWIVGYATARHVLSSYEEPHLIFLSLAWGLILAEIGWLAYHWTIAYRIPIVDNVLLPQASIVMLCIGFLAYKAYDSYFRHQKVRIGDIILPLIFTISIIAVLMIVFNGVSTGV